MRGGRRKKQQQIYNESRNIANKLQHAVKRCEQIFVVQNTLFLVCFKTHVKNPNNTYTPFKKISRLYEFFFTAVEILNLFDFFKYCTNVSDVALLFRIMH